MLSIAEDPRILGLGDLEMKDQERMQPRAGRLDMLSVSRKPTHAMRWKFGLGATDESHILRTIEYWDISVGATPSTTTLASSLPRTSRPVSST